MIKFKEWLKIKETATGTANIAVVPMRLFSEPIRRKFSKRVDQVKK